MKYPHKSTIAVIVIMTLTVFIMSTCTGCKMTDIIRLADKWREKPATPTEEWFTTAKPFDLSGTETEIPIQTSGIKHMTERNDDGGWEYVILSLFGDGFKRFMLMQMGGGGRSIRYFIEYDDGSHIARMNIASDDLMDAHKWTVTRDDGLLRVFLDGNQIGRSEEFTGIPKKAIAGGYSDSRRNFKGKWKGFEAK